MYQNEGLIFRHSVLWCFTSYLLIYFAFLKLFMNRWRLKEFWSHVEMIILCKNSGIIKYAKNPYSLENCKIITKNLPSDFWTSPSTYSCSYLYMQCIYFGLQIKNLKQQRYFITFCHSIYCNYYSAYIPSSCVYEF